MIEQLAEILTDSMLSIDNSSSKEFTGQDDFTVTDILSYQREEGQIVLVHTEDFTLIATDIDGEPVYAICELYDESDEYLEEGSFIEEIELASGEDETLYEIVTETTSGDDDVTFCWYRSDNFYNFMLIEKHADQEAVVYRGVEVSASDIIL